jgi:transcriptional regulator with XRE-family HTH domain
MVTNGRTEQMARAHSHSASPSSVRTALAIAKSAGFTQADLGKVLGVSERTVQSWSAPDCSQPTRVKLQRLLDISVIVSLLQDAYNDEGVRIWLHSRNSNLDFKRPIDLLAFGNHDRVLEEAISVAHARAIPADTRITEPFTPGSLNGS